MIVWIPGGGYALGDFSSRSTTPRGFAQVDGTPANRGLLDQVTALRCCGTTSGCSAAPSRSLTLVVFLSGLGGDRFGRCQGRRVRDPANLDDLDAQGPES